MYTISCGLLALSFCSLKIQLSNRADQTLEGLATQAWGGSATTLLHLAIAPLQVVSESVLSPLQMGFCSIPRLSDVTLRPGPNI
jgi:hypothetical protein